MAVITESKEDDMKITVYGYQNEIGKISAYRENLSKDYTGGQALAVEVEVPDSLNPYESVSGDTCVEYEGMKYALNEILTVSKDDAPTLALPSKGGTRYMGLKKISEEWVSKAMYI